MTRPSLEGDAEALASAWTDHLGTVRWFGAKGSGAAVSALEPLAPYTPEGAWPLLRSEVATLAHPDGHEEYYHLLVAWYPEPRPDALGAADLGGVRAWAVDATTDPDAVAAFVDAVRTGSGSALQWWRELPAGAAVKVWGGEQSNTTLVVGEDALFKLFRRIEPGPNLDTEVLLALEGRSAPGVLGRLTGEWPPGVRTDLGLVMERVPAARDGWELATEACASGADFAEEARALGAALRAVHERLASVFGTAVRSGDGLADLMGARLATAVAQAPELAPHAGRVAASFAGLRGRELVVQRVHGDFHLGQTLRNAEGWTIIDFEGEPAKTAAERRALESTWRDVAGMVRSFDYARSAHADPSSPPAVAWADACRAAFLAGYASDRPDEAVLRAYELDKAVYEVLYELRNRPSWVPIPLRAIEES